MISKELLSEVLGEEVSAMHIRGNKLNYVVPNYETEEDGEIVYIDLGTNINIYELAHKCKEWAYEKGYFIYSIFAIEGEGSCYLTHEYNISKRLKTFDADTEPEAIFQACEWILREKS